jgi:hypothetical protein
MNVARWSIRRRAISLLGITTVGIALIVGYSLWSVDRHLISDQILYDVHDAPIGTTFSLQDVGPRAWSSLYVFGPYDSAQAINQGLGFSWNGADLSFDGSDCLFVFVGQRHVVVASALVSRQAADFTGVSDKADRYLRSQRFVERPADNGKWPTVYAASR